jgi:hypothetical protein
MRLFAELRKFLLLAPLSFAGIFPASAATYVDLFNTKALLKIETNAVYLTDLGREASQCTQSEEFVCIRSRDFNFAVPRDPARTEWTFEGEHYKVTGHSSENLFGMFVSYTLIAVTGRTEVTYAYSPIRGVLAIRGKTGRVFILSGPCGFARLTETAECQGN